LAIIAFLTDFADQAVLLPLALMVTVAFAVMGWRRGAVAWLVVIGLTLAVMLALKMFTLACGHLMPPGLHSPSGHTAAAGAIYGGLLGLIARRVSGHAGWTVPCALAIAVVIAATRLALGVHTLPDVLVGSGVGVVGALALAGFAGPPPATVKLLPVITAGIILILGLHGLRLPAEAAIRVSASHIWPFSACAISGGSQT
jgi:membrane-associated phospholipid phosphatase